MASALVEAPPRIAGKYERLCWERHTRDLAQCTLGHPKGLWFDPEAGQRAVDFIERYCRHYEGELAGQLIVMELWQRDIYRAVFGWMRADGTRRYRTAYIEIPRKNGKSFMGSGTGLLLTIADGEHGAQVYSAATKKDQAKVVHDGAVKMVKKSSELRKFVRTFRNNISCERMTSKFEPLGADSSTLDGLNAHGLIEDETHAHTDRHVHDVLTTSMGARRQPLSWIITTAGVFAPESIGWELHQRAIEVLDGVIEDDAMFAYIAAADVPERDAPVIPGDQAYWELPEIWAQANPNLGVSVRWDYMAEQCERAKTTPSYLNTFLRYHLNIWTQQRERWIPIEAWNACQRVVDADALGGKECYGALDLSATTDITALCLCFLVGDGLFDFLWQFWCPEDTIMRRSKEDRVPYDAWTRDSWMIATPGNVVDYSFVQHAVAEAAKRYRLLELAYDPWNATETATRLTDVGITMVEFRQGYASMSEPSKSFEKLVTAGKCGHVTPRGPNPVQRWMMANAAIVRDSADNIKPDKSRASGRIDGVITGVMSLGRANIHVDPASIYETRGLLST